MAGERDDLGGRLQGRASRAGSERTLGFLRWTLHDGQRYCAALHYVPLPLELVQRADAKLNASRPAGR
jgi:hypothetical protein